MDYKKLEPLVNQLKEVNQQANKLEKTVKIMGREVSEIEAEEITVEMELANFSSSLKHLKEMGVANKFIFGEIINSFDYSELNALGSDIDSYLRGREYN